MSQPTEDQYLVTAALDPNQHSEELDTQTLTPASAAVDEWRKLAERGEVDAQFRLGKCYINGEGVAKDASQAVNWFRDAAERGHARGQSGLGYCYLKGEGVTKDIAQAVELFRDAVEQGHPDGQFWLGYCYLEGEGLTKDASKAVKLFRAAAEQGHARGQSGLGYCYLKGWGLSKDVTEAVKLFRAAAEQGNAFAQAYLGHCYLNGLGVERNAEQAVKLFRDAAKQGHPDGKCGLGYCYLYGEVLTKDAEKAVELFHDAAEQGHAFAQAYLGHCYLNGLGVKREITKAVELFRDAVEQGNAFAQAYLGHCYLHGLGLTKNAEKAVELFRDAAEQGNASAQFRLGFCHLCGWGVADRDAEKAVTWFRAAAEQGDATAQTMLGIFCFKGEGIAKDAKGAVTWFRAAAKQGDVFAQTMLGISYWTGVGVDRNAEKAMDWLKLVAEQENFLAQLTISYTLSVNRDTPAYDGMNSETWLIRLATTSDLNISRSQPSFPLPLSEFIATELTPHWNFLREKSATFPPAKVALARLIKAHYFDGLADTIADMPDPDTLIQQAAEAHDISGLYFEGLRHFEAEKYEESRKYFELAKDAMKEDPQISSLLHSAMTNSGGGTPVADYPYKVKFKLLDSTREKLDTLRLRESETEKRKAIEDLMAIFAHKFRGAVVTIKANAANQNEREVYIDTARSMGGLLDIASVLSTSPEFLQANLTGDDVGQATPLSTLTKSLRDLIVELTSKSNQGRLSPYYMACAQRQGWVSHDLTLSEWSQTLACYQYEETLQTQWDHESHALIHADIGALQRWMEQHWLPLHIAGFDEDDSSFSDYGPKDSLLRVIFTEVLKNAIKHSDPNAARPILLEWIKAEAGLSIRCTNHSTRATRMRAKSKGSGSGLKFLRRIASNLGGKLDEDLYSEPSSICIHLPNWTI